MKSITMPTKRGIACAIALAMGMAAAPAANALLAPGHADTYISANSTEQQKNFGADRMMKVSPTRFSLIRFNLAPTVPQWTCSQEIDKATLMLWVKTLDAPGLIDVQVVNEDWNEMGVTWKNRPSATWARTVDVNEAGQYLFIDVTAEVRAWVNGMNAASGECSQGGMPNFGLLLSPNYAQQASAEFDTNASGGIVPMLDITLFDHSVAAPGAQGPAGEKGAKGDTGPAGPKGDTGPQGPKGDTGAQGPKGDIGAQGLKGDTGAQGLKGDKGDTGAQGLKGETGVQGLKGDKGDTGAQGLKGDTGAQGLKGDAGAQGPKGDPGIAGAPGAQGSVGATGPQGAKGDTGATGATGPTGATGAQGPQGIPGVGGLGSVTVRSISGAPGQGLVQVGCNAGEVALSGGGMSSNPNKFMLKSYPTFSVGSTPDGWLLEMTAAGQDLTTVFVVCAQ